MKKKICIPCIQQKMYYNHLKTSSKQKAINEQRSYAIWFDTEDKKYYSLPYSEASNYVTKQDFEIISKYP